MAVVASLALTVPGCASDSTDPSLTTVPMSPSSVPDGPALPGVEPGTNLELMVDDPPQSDEADPSTSRVDPGSDG